eukprot:Awhi_evm1s6426
MFSEHQLQLQYLEENYGALAANLTFESVHTDDRVANCFRLFLMRQYCCENYDCYEKILEFEDMFLCSCAYTCSNSYYRYNGFNDCPTSSSSEFSIDSSNDSSTDSIDSSKGEREVNLSAKVKNDLIRSLITIQERSTIFEDDVSHSSDAYGQEVFESDRFLFAQAKSEVRAVLEHDLFIRFLVDLSTQFATFRVVKRNKSLDTSSSSCKGINHTKNLRLVKSSASLEKLQMHRKHESLDLLPNDCFIDTLKKPKT